MAKKNKPIKARNKYVLEAINASGAGVHGDTKHNTHKRSRGKFKNDYKKGKYDVIAFVK